MNDPSVGLYWVTGIGLDDRVAADQALRRAREVRLPAKTAAADPEQLAVPIVGQTIDDADVRSRRRQIIATTSQYAGRPGAVPATTIRADVTVVFATSPAASSASHAGSAADACTAAARDRRRTCRRGTPSPPPAAAQRAGSLRPVEPHRVVDEHLLLEVFGRRNARDEIDQFAVVGHMRLHVQVRPIGAPQDAVGIAFDQRAAERHDVVVRRARFR